jgi:hypothetical protein
MSVRAKFRVQSITSSVGTIRNEDGSYGSGEVKTIKMSPTYDSNPESENGKFWAASPGGELSLNVVNPKAVEQFELGKDYYLDFTKAE